MFRSIRVLGALCIFGQLTLAHGAECPQSFAQVGLFASLPAEVRAGILSGNRYQGEVAESNGSFNATDVGVGPHRRFLFAAMSPTAAAVSVEHGGRGYFVEQWRFARVATGWVLVGAEPLQVKPSTWVNFVRATCQMSAGG